jgi:REP element-mobilizing transposase RayT
MSQDNTTTKEGYVIRDQTLPHFITATVVDWIDVFTRKTYRDTFIECLDYCITNKAMVLYGYVIMSNHIHLIVQSRCAKCSCFAKSPLPDRADISLRKIARICNP